MFAVLGLGNSNYDANSYRMLKAKGQGGGGGGSDEVDSNGPAKYYNAIGLHIGEFFWAFRCSLGDFHAIAASG